MGERELFFGETDHLICQLYRALLKMRKNFWTDWAETEKWLDKAIERIEEDHNWGDVYDIFDHLTCEKLEQYRTFWDEKEDRREGLA